MTCVVLNIRRLSQSIIGLYVWSSLKLVTAEINLNYQTIEDSCTLQMTTGHSYKHVNVGLLRYKQQCKDFDAYVSCVMEKRSYWDVANINIPVYDRYFPRDSDLRYAGYVFCKSYLPILLQLFPPEFNMSNCHIPVRVCRDKHVNEYDVINLRNAVHHRDVETSLTISCRILAPYTDCIRQAYLKCSYKYEKLMDYELGKMGGRCLASVNLTAPLVAMRLCDPRFDPRMFGKGNIIESGGSPVLWSSITATSSLIIMIFVNALFYQIYHLNKFI